MPILNSNVKKPIRGYDGLRTRHTAWRSTITVTNNRNDLDFSTGASVPVDITRALASCACIFERCVPIVSQGPKVIC